MSTLAPVLDPATVADLLLQGKGCDTCLFGYPRGPRGAIELRCCLGFPWGQTSLKTMPKSPPEGVCAFWKWARNCID